MAGDFDLISDDFSQFEFPAKTLSALIQTKTKTNVTREKEQNMEKREKDCKIDLWLEKIYGKGNVPAFQKTEETVEFLLKLRELTDEEERGLELVADLQNHQMGEYTEQIKSMKLALSLLGLENTQQNKARWICLPISCACKNTGYLILMEFFLLETLG